MTEAEKPIFLETQYSLRKWISKYHGGRGDPVAE